MTGGASNRQRGDYLERQAKAALGDLGWIMIRAAGSHGIMDLVALRAGNTPLLVSCKTNGRIGPGERVALCEAAALAGARPVMACRRKRGWIALLVVRPDGFRDLDSIRVPRRVADPGDVPS